MDTQTDSVQEHTSQIHYDQLACSNRLLYVARALPQAFTMFDAIIDIDFIIKQIKNVEERLSHLSYPHTADALPTLKQCLADLQTVNDSLYHLEATTRVGSYPTIFIDYVVMALHTEIDKIDSLL